MTGTLDSVVDQPPVLPAPNRSPQRRKSRRTPYQRRQRRWQTLFPIVVIAIALVILAGAWFRPGNAKTSKKTNNAHATNSATGAAVTGSTFLFGHVNTSGVADLLILFGLSGNNSSALILPTATQVEAPSFGEQTLANLASFGDSSLLQLTIANALGIRVDSTALLNDKELQKALGPVHDFQVNLDHSVTATLNNHTQSFAGGTHSMSLADAAALLAYEGKGGQLAWGVVHQAILEGWLKKLSDKSLADQTVAADNRLAPLQNLAQHKTQFITLPVQHLGVGNNTELFSIRQDQAPKVMRANFGGSLINAGQSRPRVLILNGTGTVGLAQKVSQCVVPAGGEVSLTGNVPNFGVKETLVSFSQNADQTIASKIQAALGVGTLHKVESTSDAVDITVEVGSDFHDCVAQ